MSARLLVGGFESVRPGTKTKIQLKRWLKIFDLFAHKLGVIWTENLRVGAERGSRARIGMTARLSP